MKFARPRSLAEWAATVLLIGFALSLACLPEADARGFAASSCNRVVNGHAVCAQPLVAKAVHHAAPVKVVEQVVVEKVVDHHAYAPPVQNFFYSTGPQLAQEALMASAVKSAMAEYQFNATVNGTISGGVSGATQAQTGHYQPPAAPSGPPRFNFSAPAEAPAACANCHAGGSAQGGFAWESMTAEQRLSAVQRTLEESMPPGGGLSPAEQNEVVRGLLNQ